MECGKENQGSSYPTILVSFIIDLVTQCLCDTSFANFQGKNLVGPDLLDAQKHDQSMWSREVTSCSRTCMAGAHSVNGKETTFNAVSDSWGDVQKEGAMKPLP